MFQEKMESTHLHSRNFWTYEKLVKKGRAHMIMKNNVKKRRGKLEIEEEKRQKEEEKKEVAELKNAKAFLATKNLRPSDIPQIARQNEDLIVYVREKGLMDDQGNLKP